MYQQYIARNPVTGEPLSPEESFTRAQQTAQNLQQQGRDAYPLADGRVMMRRTKNDRHGASMKAIKQAQYEALLTAYQRTTNSQANPDNLTLTRYGQQLYATYERTKNSQANPDNLNQLYP